MRWTKSSKYWENRTQQWLVGGIPTPLKNIKVSWDDEIPNIWKNKNVPNQPPTRWNIKAGLRWKYVSEEENKHLVNVVCGMEEHRNGVSTKKRCQRLDSE